MADTIVIDLRDLQTGHVSWYPAGKTPSPLAPRGDGPLTEAAEKLRGWRLVAIVSANDLLLTRVNIPSKNKQRLLQAVPFALENDLTEEIETLHFAVDTKAEDGYTAVAVISRDRLDGWLEQLQSHDLRPLSLVPDVLCLPWSLGEWSLLLSSNQALVRTGLSSGFACEPASLPRLLEIALDEAQQAPERILLLREPETRESEVASILAGIQSEIQVSDLEGPATPLLAGNLDDKHALNLLQGEYKQLDRMTVQWRRWLPAAILFGLLFALNLGTSIMDYSNYRAQSEELAAQIRQVYREAFPNSKRIVDPKVQMEQQLKQLRRGQAGDKADFLSLISHPADAINKLQGTQLESISYRDGQLDLKLTLKELQALEKLKQQIENSGLAVEIKSANASGNQVTSHLRIKGSGT